MQFSLWSPPVFGQKQQLYWHTNDQLSYNIYKDVHQGGTGTLTLGPTREWEAGSQFSWQMFALNNWSGHNEGGGKWYPVPGANLSHFLSNR
jgi:hypothetical protein